MDRHLTRLVTYFSSTSPVEVTNGTAVIPPWRSSDSIDGLVHSSHKRYYEIDFAFESAADICVGIIPKLALWASSTVETSEPFTAVSSRNSNRRRKILQLTTTMSKSRKDDETPGKQVFKLSLCSGALVAPELFCSFYSSVNFGDAVSITRRYEAPKLAPCYKQCMGYARRRVSWVALDTCAIGNARRHSIQSVGIAQHLFFSPLSARNSFSSGQIQPRPFKGQPQHAITLFPLGQGPDVAFEPSDLWRTARVWLPGFIIIDFNYYCMRPRTAPTSQDLTGQRQPKLNTEPCAGIGTFQIRLNPAGQRREHFGQYASPHALRRTHLVQLGSGQLTNTHLNTRSGIQATQVLPSYLHIYRAHPASGGVTVVRALLCPASLQLHSSIHLPNAHANGNGYGNGNGTDGDFCWLS